MQSGTIGIRRALQVSSKVHVVKRQLYTTQHHHRSGGISSINVEGRPKCFTPARPRAFSTNALLTVTNTTHDLPVGAAAFGNSEKYQCVIHDLFMSYARPRNEIMGDHTPCLKSEDLKSLLISIGERPSEKTLKNLMVEADKDGNGTIELEEFLSSCDGILATKENDGDDEKSIDIGALVDTFRTLDRDGNGVLTLDELEGLLSATGGHIKPEDAKEILHLADRRRNGVIELDEFIDFVTDPAAGRYSWRLRSGFRVLLIIGGPGSGKGELCKRLCERAGIRHFSSGDMLREEVASGSPLGKSIEAILKEGSLVPSTTMIALLKKHIGQFPGALVALDGYPRTIENFRDFTEILGPPECAIYVDVPDEVMIERILGRAKNGSGRIDDNIKTAEKRIQTFYESTMPTLEQLYKSGIQIHTLDGTRSPEEVWEQLLECDSPVRHRVVESNDHDEAVML